MRLSYDHEATLIKLVGGERDKYGNEITTENKTVVFCYMRSATRQERSIAGHTGYEARVVIGMHPYEYQEEEFVEFDGKRYTVISDYIVDQETIELTLGEKLGD